MAHVEFHLVHRSGNVFVRRASSEIGVKSTTMTASHNRVKTEADVLIMFLDLHAIAHKQATAVHYVK